MIYIKSLITKIVYCIYCITAALFTVERNLRKYNNKCTIKCNFKWLEYLVLFLKK